MDDSSYEILRRKKVIAARLLEWHFTEHILKKIKRRLTARKCFKDPWKVCICVDIHRSLYFLFYHAVNDFATSFGRTIETVKKKKVIVNIKIVFTHLGTFKYHLRQICNKDNIEYFLSREWSNKGKAEVVVNEEKPAILNYDTVKQKLTFQLNYNFCNRYGTVCV